MEIKDIANKRVKICKASITVKDENDKTRGVVRGTTKFTDLQPNKAFMLYKTVCNAGIWGSSGDAIQRTIYADEKLYYLHDLRADEQYERYFADKPERWPAETKSHEQRQKIREQAAQYMTVIPCYVI